FMTDDVQSAAEDAQTPDEDTEAVSQDEVTDEYVDAVSESLMEGDTVATAENADGEGEEQTEEEEPEIEEEKVKDEIDIQIDLLHDPDWVVRREAVVTLGEMGDERCVEPLVRALRDGDWQVREAAVEAIAEVGSPAVELLVRYVRDWEARKYVIQAMGKINDERVLDPLMSMLHNDEFKDDATRALIELGKPAVPKLIAALTDREEFVRKQAILALGEIKDSEAVDPLIAMLQDQDWFTRLTAAAALEQIGDLRARDAIKPLMKDPDLIVRLRVERILAAWKKQPAGA
ncbi:MAG: HEAT repeat domain-containing protein, partial [Nitrospira sp. SB0666_bin_27]|nr:HEAT repeat domain-containing protein [Nitrospira sp. SB0666_bin_27]